MNSNTSRTISAIYTCDNYPTQALVTNYNTTKIIGNNITHLYDDLLTGDRGLNEVGIIAINTKFIDIQYNTIKSTPYCDITKFIMAYAGTGDNDSCIGSIVYNTIYAETPANNTYSNYDSRAIIYYPNGLNPITTVRMVVNKNRGQLYVKDTNCYEFIQYGYNTKSFTFGGGPIDSKPTIRATVLANCRSSLFKGASSNNLNLTNQMDILSTITTWLTLPKGLYYTNAVYTGDGYALDALCNLIGSPLGYKHQTLIPINVDDFTKLIGLSIPVYLYNADGYSTATITLNASLILCNTVDDYTRITYVPGNSSIVSVTNWEEASCTLVAGAHTLITLTHNCFNSLAGQDGYWLTPIFETNTVGSTGKPSVQAYIVLAMTTSNVADSTTGINMLFAIPYARATFIY